MDIYLVRHGESVGNTIPGYSWCDPELSERGHVQAKLLAEELNGINFTKIFSSPLLRTVQTISYTAKNHPDGPAVIELLPELMEVGTNPDYPGAPRNELFEIYDKLIIRSSSDTTKGSDVLGDEKTPEIRMQRAKRVVKYLKENFSDDDTILISAHGTFNNYLLLAMLDFDYNIGFNFSQHNACISLVRYFVENGIDRTKAVFINNTRHLSKDLLT